MLFLTLEVCVSVSGWCRGREGGGVRDCSDITVRGSLHVYVRVLPD